MLAALTLAVLIADVKSSAARACPALPTDTFVIAPRVCDVLEVSGTIDGTTATLDPAFSTRAAETEMARPAPGTASLIAFNRDGQAVFTFPFTATGAFRLVLPVSPLVAATITRLVLNAGGADVERVAAGGNAPAAEALASDDSHVIFIWNAHQYPGIRIVDARDGSLIQSAMGDGTYQQIVVETSASRFLVSFSNGVRSVTRTVNILAR
jgi:hypothetical protein